MLLSNNPGWETHPNPAPILPDAVIHRPPGQCLHPFRDSAGLWIFETVLEVIEGRLISLGGFLGNKTHRPAPALSCLACESNA